MCYIYVQHYIKTVHFWLKYNGCATVRKTTKLIEDGHRVLQDIRYYFWFLCFYAFFKIQKVVTYYVFEVFRTFSRTTVTVKLRTLVRQGEYYYLGPSV